LGSASDAAAASVPAVPGAVTVAIPVLNGARYLEEVLTAVRAQEVDRDVEILIFDSGSTDGSQEIARRHGAVLHQIAKHEFSHGGTRNRMMEVASGDHVAFLTQDATPAHEGWLAALLEGFAQADDVAAVFGPHDARPDASHMIKSEMERHFASWGNGATKIDVQRLDPSPAGIAAYRSFPGQLTFLSDVNCAIARWAWERIPYREVPYAEDQLLGRELIEAGFAKVFHPDARVLHSHDYPPVDFLRRYFDEFRSLREVLGFKQPWGPKRTLWDVRGLVGADKRWLEEHGVRGRALRRPLLVSGRHHAIRTMGAVLGTRADRVPGPLRRALSLEGRSSFTPYEVPAGLLDAGSESFDPNWRWDFVRRAFPRRPLALELHTPRTGPLTITWIIPVWSVGSGGHTTIFRLIRQMERRGHSCSIHVFDPDHSEPRSASELREEIREHFIDIDAQVFRGLSGFSGADVAIATEWRTAFPVRDLPGCGEKVYLVQDHEPEFYATSSESIWAEESYRMGYRCIAYTPWMANILREQWGLEAQYFECGTDTDVYKFAGEEDREPSLVLVYARGETERRAVELALAALATAFERRPGLRVIAFGSNLGVSAPFPLEDLGVRPPAELAELYRRASVGLVFSLTTHSLVAHEMMASGLPVVELEGDNVASALGGSGELVELAERTPDAIADAVERLLDDRERAAAMARRARSFVEERTWERAGDQVEAALLDYVSRPR
jgi:glycosyltransferase involved in cell wall biosynthesis